MISADPHRRIFIARDYHVIRIPPYRARATVGTFTEAPQSSLLRERGGGETTENWDKLTADVLGKMNGFAALPLLLPLGRGDVLETLGDLLKNHVVRGLGDQTRSFWSWFLSQARLCTSGFWFSYLKESSLSLQFQSRQISWPSIVVTGAVGA